MFDCRGEFPAPDQVRPVALLPKIRRRPKGPPRQKVVAQKPRACPDSNGSNLKR